MYYTFLKLYEDNYAGESNEHYEILAETSDRSIAETISNSIPYRLDKEKIVCVYISTIDGDYEQYHNFDYNFTPEYDKTIQVY